MKIKDIMSEVKANYRAKVYTVKSPKPTSETKPNTIKKHGEEAPKKKAQVKEDDAPTIASVSGDKVKLSTGQEVPTTSITPDASHPGQFSMAPTNPNEIKPGSQVNTMPATSEEQGDEEELGGPGDVGGDGTDAFMRDVQDANFERAQGYGPDQDGSEVADEGLFGSSAEDYAKTNPQMATLLQFRAKYHGTPYADQIEKRIQVLKDRLDMAGEPGGGTGAPVDAKGNLKQVVPPEQFDTKQLREADDALLEKMRMIAGLR